eukprot:COSAG06_NODE_2378_length_6982_cov_36.074531_6_plen_39_part_00
MLLEDRVFRNALLAKAGLGHVAHLNDSQLWLVIGRGWA